MCTAQDREYLARRDQAIQEYYKSKGIKADASGAGRQALPQAAPQATPVQPGLVVGGRCGKTTVTWLEAAKISRESIRVKRTQPDGTSTQLASVTVYDRAEAQGTRYWLADSGLPDNQRYEYSLRYKDMAGREIVQGPAAINLTCTEQDKAFLAQQRKALEEHYRQQGIEAPQQAAPAAPAGYELSSQVYQVDPGTSPRKGSRNAAVRIVVFTDFECVHCGTWARTLDALLQQHPRDVQIVFKSFPIPYHQHAEQAALAAFAAGRQGMFWEMHDLLFQNPQALTEADARTYATAIGLKVDEFEQSLRDDTFKKIIAEDRALGLKLGVKNAPTTFINGRSLVGSPPLDYVQDIVRKILAGRVGR